jgi:hypothetical protein
VHLGHPLHHGQEIATLRWTQILSEQACNCVNGIFHRGCLLSGEARESEPGAKVLSETEHFLHLVFDNADLLWGKYPALLRNEHHQYRCSIPGVTDRPNGCQLLLLNGCRPALSIPPTIAALSPLVLKVLKTLAPDEPIEQSGEDGPDDCGNKRHGDTAEFVG